VKIIRLKEAPVQRWSAGTTTELFIYPEGSSFKDANFNLRISIATVEEETSIFTSFPNTERTLIVLEGHQHLVHSEKSVKLGKLDIHRFSGDCTTNCTGTSTNFNVMSRGERTATTEIVRVSEASFFAQGNNAQIQFLFVLEGQLTINNQKVFANEGITLSSETTITVERGAQYILVTYPKINKS